jgi:HEAT repeats/PBS lyase HEAT-like repeat
MREDYAIALRDAIHASKGAIPMRLNFGRMLGKWLLASGIFSAAGCANFYDTVTSRDFRVRDMFSTPDPMTVLRTSEDGDARAKAILKLKEPKKSGGSDQDQNEVVQILTDTAINEKRPLCRLAAIEALGRFEDPRSAPALVQAYQNSNAFPTEVANPIRCESLQALGRKNTPEGNSLLVRVAGTQRETPARPNVQLAGYNSNDELNKLLGRFDPDAQMVRDPRLAAVKALGESRNPQAVSVLIPILAEKDVALHNRAQEALQLITSRHDVAADPEAWKKALNMH